MAAQAFTNLSGNQNGNMNEPTSYVAADGFVGTPAYPLNPNNPTFGAMTFPAGLTIPAGTSIPASAVVHGVIATLQIPLAVTAVTTTAITATLPAGAIVRSMAVYTTATFTGNTSSVTIAIGSAASGAQYVAAVSISAIGVLSLTLVAAAAGSFLSFPSGSPNVFITLTQAANATAVGAGTLSISYIVP